MLGTKYLETMSKYRPVLINIDNEGVKMAKKRSNEKLALFNKAIDWIKDKGIEVSISDSKQLHDSFVRYFSEAFYELYRDKNLLGLSAEKLMEVKEINLSELAQIEMRYKNYELETEFNSDGSISFPVNLKVYERYTKSSEENAKLRDYRKFIDAIELVSKHTHIYPHQIALATSGEIKYDLANQKYIPNI